MQILREGLSGGNPVEQLCRDHGISQATYYLWKRKFGAMNEPDVKRLRELEKENARLKKMVADRDLEIDVMKEFLEPGFNEFQITVAGNPFVYRSYQLPDGTVNVGTAFPR